MRKRYNSCWGFFDALWQPFSLDIFIFILSVLTYRMRKEVFLAWLHFAYWWIPLSALIIFTTPTASHSWAIGGPTRETISFIMGGLFFFVSIILIVRKSLQLRRK